MAQISGLTQASDAVSRLLQLQARVHGINDVRWSGKGLEDVALMMEEWRRAILVKECLFKGVIKLTQMPEMNTLPEAIQAQITSIILEAHAKLELEIAREPKPIAKGTPSGMASGST